MVFNYSFLKFSSTASKLWIDAVGKDFRKCNVLWPRWAPTSKTAEGFSIPMRSRSFSTHKNHRYAVASRIRCFNFRNFLIVLIKSASVLLPLAIRIGICLWTPWRREFLPDQVVGTGFKVSVIFAIVINVPDSLQNGLHDQQLFLDQFCPFGFLFRQFPRIFPRNALTCGKWICLCCPDTPSNWRDVHLRRL